MNDYDKKLKEYERKYNAKGKPTGKDIIPIGDGILIGYKELTEEQLVQYINSLLSDINRKKKKLIELENHLKRVKKRVDLLKKAKPHEYYPYFEFFKELLKVTESLNIKVNQEYRDNMDFILSKGTKRKFSPEKREKYNKAIFNYLGKVIGKVFHIEKEYNVRSINLLKGIIYTEEGSKIKFIDMGTGQSQSAYLKSLLSTSEDKIIIALFDEISSMDSKSLEPVYEKMKELYEKGKLLVAIVVQRADHKVTIKNLLN